MLSGAEPQSGPFLILRGPMLVEERRGHVQGMWACHCGGSGQMLRPPASARHQREVGLGVSTWRHFGSCVAAGRSGCLAPGMVSADFLS